MNYWKKPELKFTPLLEEQEQTKAVEQPAEESEGLEGLESNTGDDFFEF